MQHLKRRSSSLAVDLTAIARARAVHTCLVTVANRAQWLWYQRGSVSTKEVAAKAVRGDIEMPDSVETAAAVGIVVIAGTETD